MDFALTTIDDLPVIRELFAAAIAYQKVKFGKHWNGLNEAQLIAEIGNGHHWKVIEASSIAAFFSIAFTDALIWGEWDADPAIYLHRIVTNPGFRGRGYVRAITDWAAAYGRKAGAAFIRLDTDVDNSRLNMYYRECGYNFCGVKKFMDKDRANSAIPLHYFGSGLSLFERAIT
jgi:ribosomal protein S18 acetylase RimI-like enzyme